MRDIKFRYWDKKKREMIYCGKLYIADSHISFTEEEFTYIDDHPEDNKNYVVMQYTGLKDENGKEIYEGDIVVNIDYGMCTICFGEGWVECGAFPISAGFYLYRDDAIEVSVADFVPNELIIIGNIYENPNLLVKK